MNEELIKEAMLTKEECLDLFAAYYSCKAVDITKVSMRDFTNEAQLIKAIPIIKKQVAEEIESYFVTTIQPDGVKMHHIDDPEWQSLKDKLGD